MSLLVLLQARLGSTRLPGKVLLPLAGIPLVRWPALRLASIAEVLTCIPDTPANDPLAAAIEGPAIRGSEDDVLSRFLRALDSHPEATVLIRATADNPFVLPELACAACEILAAQNADYCSIEGSALGTTVEVLRAEALRALDALATSPEEREHPTLGLLRRPAHFRIARYHAPARYSTPDIRLTIDTPSDYTRALALVAHLADPLHCTWDEIAAAAPRLPQEHSAVEVQQGLAEVRRLKEQAWNRM